MNDKFTISFKEAEKREMEDNHLTTEERRQYLNERNIPFTEETLNDIFTDEIL